MGSGTLDFSETAEINRELIETANAAYTVERDVNSDAPSLGDTIVLTISSGSVSFSKIVLADEERLKQLRRNRTLFGMAALISALVLAACLYFKVSYEPAAATLCCFVGMFVVFAMKINDAAR